MIDRMKVRKACWTCTARRIQCDGALPTCQKCAQSRRPCQGYAMRLSWPRDNDKKRAMTSDDLQLHVAGRGRTEFHFINTTWDDVRHYQSLSALSRPLHILGLPQSPSERRIMLRSSQNHTDLVQHFHDTAYLSLVTFSSDRSQIRDVLLRMTLAVSTTSGLALLSALLAFSSLNHGGLHQEAVQLKISAIQFLAASTKEGSLNISEAAQLVATSMLLCAFEMFHPSESSDEWLWYVRGAMDTTQATRLASQSYDGDISHIIDWVYYHDTVSRFPMHHLRRKPISPSPPSMTNSGSIVSITDRQYPSLPIYRLSPPSHNPKHAILNLLSEACDALLPPSDPQSHSTDYKTHITSLQRRAETLPSLTTTEKASTDPSLAVEIFQVATRIYLLRATQNYWTPSTRLDAEIDGLFAGIVTSCECRHFFPLFVVACEATTEERRAAVMGALDRVENGSGGKGRARGIGVLRGQIVAIWVRLDLFADGDLLADYVGVVGSVIASGALHSVV